MPILTEFNKDDLPRLKPIEFQLESEISNIFSVPFKNTVGTNDLNNAITLLELKDEKVNYIEKQKDFVDIVSLGEMIYMPLLSKKQIAYTLTRELIVCDIKKSQTNIFTVSDNDDEVISDAGIWNISKNQYFIDLDRTYFGNDGELINEKLYKICEVDKHSLNKIAEMELGDKGVMGKCPWMIHDRKLIYYDQDKLNVLDSGLKPVSHPLVDLYEKENRRIGKIDQLYVHPKYSMGLLVSENNGITNIWCADWEIKPAKIVLLTDQLDKIKKAYFSPAGDWLVLCNHTKKDKYEYFIMDINKKYFSYIGPLLGYLGETESPSSIAWIEKPLSFVVSQEEKLLKWEIKNTVYRK
jgi:hypothetical protein